jgi:hypothetical protein
MRNLHGSQRDGNGITAHYRYVKGYPPKTDANVRRLRAICRIFGLGPTAVARAGNVSQPYVSRILSDRDSFVGNQEFYRRLEGKLGSLIDTRQTQFFRVAPQRVGKVEQATQLLGE